jgi:hypothetical protein
MRNLPPSFFLWKRVNEAQPLRGFRVPPDITLALPGGEILITDPKGKRVP